ncbi:MAG: permease [Spirochaetales bacterium]|nr:permease [Spirochaetales bacterium]
MKKIKLDKALIVSLVLLGATAIYSFPQAGQSLSNAWFQIWEMLKVVPPIFLMIGLLDVWIPRETMIKMMGDKSGALGIVLAFLFGTFSAGPLVAAFPVAIIMLKKGARFANVMFFLTIWASAKLPILVFQSTTMGLEFTVVSNVVLIGVYLIGSYVIEKSLGKKELEAIYRRAENFDKKEDRVEELRGELADLSGESLKTSAS